MSTTTGSNNNNKTRLLYVDDESDLLHVVKNGLEMDGFEVDTARSADEVLNRDISKYDMLILDIRMPKIDGFELYEKLKDKIAEFKIRVCFFTAFQVHGQDYNRLFPTWKGACFIVKPVSVRQFAKKIRELLGAS